jgi:hypothetical protein
MHGVEGNLWKLCFYKKIEEFRRALARGQEQLQDPAKCAAAEQVLAAMTLEFGKFLDKSSALYLALLQKVALACSLVLPGYGRAPEAAWPACLDVEVDAANLSAAQHEAMVGTCYRSLIYLGDLERYRGTCMHNIATYNWAGAKRHYRTALLLRPHAGNPHNQCGVIANYSSDDLSGLFHYARSILCDEPYLPQGRANLEMLLRKNRDTVLVDLASNSQQRRRMEKDPTLRAIIVGRWFVRPLGLLWLLAGQEHVKAAEEDALTRLPALLDADRQPSDFCLKMVCSCIFAVTDLERQLQSADEHMQTGGGGVPDPDYLRISYQLALEFTFSVALILMRSAKATHHHLQAVAVICVWLLQHPHLVAPQKSADRVCYDCERLRRAQGSFAEGLVDLVNLNVAILRNNALNSGTSEQGDGPCTRKILPEDLLLAGWTPLRGYLEPLLQTGCHESSSRRLLVGLKSVDDGGELLRVRLQRIMALAVVLSQAPWPILCLNPSSGELSVEGLGGTRSRSKQASKPVVAVGSSQALPQQLLLGQARAAPVDVANQAFQAPALDSLAGSSGSSAPGRESGDVSERGQVCGECGAEGQEGRADEFDGIFYCDACWDNLEALDELGAVDKNGGVEHDAHCGPYHRAAAVEGVLGAASSVVAWNVAAASASFVPAAATEQEESIEWGRDEEAFGSASLAVDSSAMTGSLDGLAQQAALFAAASRSPLHPAGLTAGHCLPAVGDRPQGSEDVGDCYLEQLVQQMVGSCDATDPSGHASNVSVPAGEDSMEGEEEIVVFQPRSQAVCRPRTDQGAEDLGKAAVSSLEGEAAFHQHGVWSNINAEANASFSSMVETGNSLWGGFGTGPCGFGASDAFAAKGNLTLLGSYHRAEVDRDMEGAGNGICGMRHAAMEPLSSRFSTRNPFAN